VVLRAAALPGADLFISATAGVGRQAGSVLSRGLGAIGLRPSADVAEVARGYASLSDPGRRRAFLATLRSVVGTGGQSVAAGDRLAMAESLPILIVWGSRDPIIPVSHGESAHAALPDSQLEIFDGVGHLPQLEAAGRFVAVLERFLAESEPAEFDREEWRARFKIA
jgi:pimeloyl-ACP methyl ester carboxylesterase